MYPCGGELPQERSRGAPGLDDQERGLGKAAVAMALGAEVRRTLHELRAKDHAGALCPPGLALAAREPNSIVGSGGSGEAGIDRAGVGRVARGVDGDADVVVDDEGLKVPPPEAGGGR